MQLWEAFTIIKKTRNKPFEPAFYNIAFFKGYFALLEIICTNAQNGTNLPRKNQTRYLQPLPLNGFEISVGIREPFKRFAPIPIVLHALKIFVIICDLMSIFIGDNGPIQSTQPSDVAAAACRRFIIIIVTTTTTANIQIHRWSIAHNFCCWKRGRRRRRRRCCCCCSFMHDVNLLMISARHLLGKYLLYIETCLFFLFFFWACVKNYNTVRWARVLRTMTHLYIEWI